MHDVFVLLIRKQQLLHNPREPEVYGISWCSAACFTFFLFNLSNKHSCFWCFYSRWQPKHVNNPPSDVLDNEQLDRPGPFNAESTQRWRSTASLSVLLHCLLIFKRLVLTRRAPSTLSTAQLVSFSSFMIFIIQCFHWLDAVGEGGVTAPWAPLRRQQSSWCWWSQCLVAFFFIKLLVKKLVKKKKIQIIIHLC